jgi:hypothetical protein
MFWKKKENTQQPGDNEPVIEDDEPIIEDEKELLLSMN